MTNDGLPGWPYLVGPEYAGESAAADDADNNDDDASDQTVARARVLEVLSGIFRHPARLPGDDMPAHGAGQQRRFWRDSSGRFRRPPELPPVPEDDTVLTLADAADAAAPSVGGPVRAPGVDRTGMQLRAPRFLPRPAEDAPHVREIVFPAAERTVPCPNPRRWRSAWRRANGR